LFEDIKDTYDQYQYATLSKEGEIEYQSPTRFVNKYHEGVLHEYTHRSFKLQVTPKHNLLVSQELNTGYYKDPKIKGWQLRTSEEMFNKNFKMISSGKVKQDVDDIFILPEYKTTINSRGNFYQKHKEVIVKQQELDLFTFMSFMG